jgi:hypothetical protein
MGQLKPDRILDQAAHNESTVQFGCLFCQSCSSFRKIVKKTSFAPISNLDESSMLLHFLSPIQLWCREMTCYHSIKRLYRSHTLAVCHIGIQGGLFNFLSCRIGRFRMWIQVIGSKRNRVRFRQFPDRFISNSSMENGKRRHDLAPNC